MCLLLRERRSIGFLHRGACVSRRSLRTLTILRSHSWRTPHEMPRARLAAADLADKSLAEVLQLLLRSSFEHPHQLQPGCRVRLRPTLAHDAAPGRFRRSCAARKTMGTETQFLSRMLPAEFPDLHRERLRA